MDILHDTLLDGNTSTEDLTKSLTAHYIAIFEHRKYGIRETVRFVSDNVFDVITCARMQFYIDDSDRWIGDYELVSITLDHDHKKE